MRRGTSTLLVVIHGDDEDVFIFLDFGRAPGAQLATAFVCFILAACHLEDVF